MNRQLVVIKNYTSSYPKPLTLKSGDVVKLGKRYTENPNWKDWMWCQTDKNAGWVPVQIIKMDGENGLILEDYTAQELTVQKEEKVNAIKELNGWVWCENENGANGWVPKENLKDI